MEIISKWIISHTPVITDKYHALRSYLTASGIGYKVFTYGYSSNFSITDLIPSIRGLTNFNNMIYEYIGLTYYISTGKINFSSIKAIHD